ncbi:MAG: hypothetical protein KC933_08085 [Myxococcales bacterium]|nr:hypothetical protein [Myxococcales bacterium]
MQVEFHHLGLTTRHVPETAALLESLVGARTVSGPHLGHTLVEVGGVRIALVPWRTGDPEGRGFGEHLGFALPASRRSALLARLEAAGCAVEVVGERLYARALDALVLEFLFTA